MAGRPFVCLDWPKWEAKIGVPAGNLILPRFSPAWRPSSRNKIASSFGPSLALRPYGCRPSRTRSLVAPIGKSKQRSRPMTDNLSNFMQIANGNVIGNIATVAFDIDLTGESVDSDNEKAPKYRLFTRSPRGRRVEIGGIWQRLNREKEPYYTLTISTGHSRFYANLGRYPGQDDETLYAVIPNEYLNGDRRS
jgi:uncharacterized protein (DUF736 family)